MRCENTLRSVAMLSVLSVVLSSAAHAQVSKDGRSYATRGSTLEIDTKPVGMMQSVDGGYATADVAVSRLGPDQTPMKNVTSVHYEPITVRGDVSSLTDLARRAIDKPMQVSGRLVTVSLGGRGAGSSLEFFNATATKVAITDLDAGNRDPCYIEITLAPERTQRVEGGSTDSRMAAKQERCLRSNFAVKIPGVVTNGVSKVENIAMIRELAPDNAGQMREATKNPGKVNIPNVVLTVTEASAKDFWSWYDSFLIKGDNGQDKEKTIDIQLMGPDMKTSVLTLQGTGVGIVAMRPLAGNDNVPKVEVELYVEKWAIGGGVAP
jgi:hypothetical protein